MKKLAKKLSLITAILMVFQLASFGLGVGTQGALAAAPTDQDAVFSTSVIKKGGDTVTITPPIDTTNEVWFAPDGMISAASFVNDGLTMTQATGTASTILAPATAGDYKLYLINSIDEVSAPSVVTLTVDNTPPDLISVKAELGGVPQTKSKGESLIAYVGQSVGAITATLTEEATLVSGSTGAITITGGTIPSGTPYGTFTVNESTITITPNPGNDVLAQTGTFTFTVAAGQIQDAVGNQNTETTFSLVVSNPTIINLAAISGVTKPTLGGTPRTSITKTAQYSGTVTWKPTNNPFGASTTYTATITLIPEVGYTLKGVGANFFTVMGATTVTNATDSGIVTAVFPVTGALGLAQNFTAKINSSGNVLLSWTNPPVGTYAELQILRDGAPLVSLFSGETSFVDLTAEKGKTYFYQIVVYDASAINSTITTPVYITVPMPPRALLASAGFSDSGDETAISQATTTTPSNTVKANENKTDDNKNKDDKNDLPLWGIVVLFILAIIGGYLVYTQRPRPVTRPTTPISPKSKAPRSTRKK